MTAKKGKILFLVLILGSFYSCRITSRIQKTFYVPDEFSTLEEAVHRSASGDIIVVTAGRYKLSKGLLIRQKDLSLIGVSGANKTIVVGTGTGPVISFSKNCRAVLNGFTITSNSDSDPISTLNLQGGGIYCAPFSSPAIIHNIIQNNKARFGGGIYCAFSSSPHIIQNRIIDNYAQVSGGGLFSFRAFPEIVKNRFIYNTAGNSGGAIFCNSDKALIQNNIIAKNTAFHSGGGCSYSEASCISVNNTFFSNRAFWGGGIFGVGGEFQLLNTIFWKNNDDLCLTDIKMISRPKYSNIADGDYLGINGNISSRPLFVDPNGGDYRLQPESPCRHTGDPQEMYNNPDGTRNNIGAYGGPKSLAYQREP